MKSAQSSTTWSILGLFFGIAVTIGLVVGCGGGGGGGGSNPVAPVGNQQLANLSGVVSFNGAPVADAAVYLVKPENALNTGMTNAGASGNLVKPSVATDTSFGDYSTTTDQNGAYTFNQVPVGEYTLYAIKDAQHQFVRTNVVLGAITVLDAQLTPTGELTGTVGVPAGIDAAGIMVYLQGTSFVAFTNTSGGYTVSNVPAGSYVIAVQKQGFQVVTNNVTVIAGTATTVPSIPLSNSAFGSLAGRVLRTVPVDGELSSDPIPLKLVAPSFEAYAIPALDGTFIFQGLTPGNYELVVMNAEYNFASPTPVIFSVTANTLTTTGVFSLVPRVGVGGSGRILGRITANTAGFVELRKPGTKEVRFVVPVDVSTGNFIFRNIPAGTYEGACALNSPYFFSGPNPTLPLTLAANENKIIPSLPGVLGLTISSVGLAPSGAHVVVNMANTGSLAMAPMTIALERNENYFLLPTFVSALNQVSGDFSGLNPGTYTVLVRHSVTGVQAEFGSSFIVPPLAPPAASIVVQPGRGTSLLNFRPVPWVEDYRVNLYSPTSPTLVASFVTSANTNIPLGTPGGRQFVVGIVSQAQNGTNISAEVLSSPFTTPTTFPASTSYALPITPETFVDIVAYNNRLYLQQNEVTPGTSVLYQRNLVTGAALSSVNGPSSGSIVNPQIVAGKDFIYGVYSQTGSSFVQRYSQQDITVNSSQGTLGDRIKATFSYPENALYVMSGINAGPYNVRIDRFSNDLSSNANLVLLNGTSQSFNSAQCALGLSQDGGILAYWTASNTNTLAFGAIDTSSGRVIGSWTVSGAYDFYAQDNILCDQNSRFLISVRDTGPNYLQYAAFPMYRTFSTPTWVPPFPVTAPVRSWVIDKHDRLWALVDDASFDSMLLIYSCTGAQLAQIDLPEPLLTNAIKNMAFDPITEKVAILLDLPPTGMRVYLFDAAL